MTAKPTPFTLHIPGADIADLRDRLARSRFPDSAPGGRGLTAPTSLTCVNYGILA